MAIFDALTPAMQLTFREAIKTVDDVIRKAFPRPADGQPTNEEMAVAAAVGATLILAVSTQLRADPIALLKHSLADGLA